MMATTREAAPVSLRAALRHEAICVSLEASGRVSIPDLTDRLGVSAVTVREDLKHLEARGLLSRVRGGAVAKPGSKRETALEFTSRTNRAEKEAIGAFAASLIESGQTVIIDVGSTTTALATALSPDLSDVVVVTNGLNIAQQLEAAPGVSVIVTGGTLRPLQHSLVAPMGTLLLDQLKLGSERKAAERHGAAGRFRQCGEKYEQLTRRYPKHPRRTELLYNGAVCFDQAGQRARALALRRRLVAARPHDPLAKKVLRHLCGEPRIRRKPFWKRSCRGI